MACELKDEILDSIAKAAGPSLADRLVTEYQEIVNRYARADFRPGELSGGRFAEAAFRVCQNACAVTPTALAKQLPRIDTLINELAQVPAKSAHDSFRVHIPRSLRVIYDFRSKRDVAHLGDDVSPNYMDSTLVMSVVSWVMSEIVRIHHRCDSDEAQRIVDSLVGRRLPLIWADGDRIRVLNPSLDYRSKTLLVLYHWDPKTPTVSEVFDAVEYSNISAYRRNILSPLHKEAMIDWHDDVVTLLPPGKKCVEEEILRS